LNDVDRAVEVLRSNGLVAFPTETVYGLGADARADEAVARLYAVKRRPADHPVIVHVAEPGQLDDIAAAVNDDARALATAFWPGPLTLVLTRRPGAISELVTGGRDTVGVRIPDHPVALELLRAFGGGLAAPSANRFGRVSPTSAADVRADLGGDVDVVLDGGACRVGVESTIVDCREPGSTRVLRIGAVTSEQLEAITGRTPEFAVGGEIAAPGTLLSHYAPSARVRVVDAHQLSAAIEALDDETVGVLALASVASDVTGVTVLSSPRDVDDYARVLYARFRDADRAGVDVLLVVPPPPGGIGDAVRDRIERAAAR
jgi:L-threonylcarbamoyladenylate synthase